MTAALVFAAAALLVGAASLYARKGWVRALSYAALLAALVGVGWASLGRPRPILLGVPHGTVAAYTLDEPRAIYLWLLVPGAREPIALALPWSERAASDLVGAVREAKKTRGKVKVGRNGPQGDFDSRGEAKFYVQSRPALPPKESK